MAARSTRSLAENRITHILSVCSDPIPAEVPEAGICHKRIQVEDVDYADLLIHLPTAVKFIDQALRSGGVVLVHCVQGISRSAAVVVAYSARLSNFSVKFSNLVPIVMWSRRVGMAQALAEVRRGAIKRFSMQPYYGVVDLRFH